MRTLAGLTPVFVVGAAKSGTTSVLKAFEEHPEVTVGSVKEPRFFLPEDMITRGPGAEAYERTRVRSLQAYEDLFRVDPATRAFMEGSTDYLHVEGSAERIHERFPDARIIVLIREPVARAYSEHMHVVRDCLEVESFEVALARESERRFAHWQPLFWHQARSTYYEPIRRFQAVFEPENVLVLRFEALLASQDETLRRISDFIGVRPFDSARLPHENRSGAPRIGSIQRLVMSPRTRQLLMPLLGKKLGTRLKTMASSLNLAPSPPPSPDAVNRIQQACVSDYERAIREWTDARGA